MNIETKYRILDEKFEELMAETVQWMEKLYAAEGKVEELKDDIKKITKTLRKYQKKDLTLLQVLEVEDDFTSGDESIPSDHPIFTKKPFNIGEESKSQSAFRKSRAGMHPNGTHYPVAQKAQKEGISRVSKSEREDSVRGGEKNKYYDFTEGIDTTSNMDERSEGEGETSGLLTKRRHGAASSSRKAHDELGKSKKRAKNDEDDDYLLQSNALKLVNVKNKTTTKQRSQKKLVEKQESPVNNTGVSQAKHILAQIKNIKKAWYFLEPVEPIELNIPDYTMYVKRPMDLGTVTKKLSNGEYNKDLTQFVTDIRQTFMNAVIYNHPNTDVYSSAAKISNNFEKLLTKTKLPIPTPVGFGRSTRWIGYPHGWRRADVDEPIAVPNNKMKSFRKTKKRELKRLARGRQQNAGNESGRNVCRDGQCL